MEHASDDFPQQEKLEYLLPNFAGYLLPFEIVSQRGCRTRLPVFS